MENERKDEGAVVVTRHVAGGNAKEKAKADVVKAVTTLHLAALHLN